MRLFAFFLLLLPAHISAPPDAFLGGPGVPQQVIIFTREWPDAKVPAYTVVVNEIGPGFYWEHAPELDPHGEPMVPRLVFTEKTIKTMFSIKDLIRANHCETRTKNIALTGKKTLFYMDNDQESTCVFNYSDDDRINTAAKVMQEIAETMQAGDRLKHAHRFDHLGLDAELDSVVAAAKDGRVIELQNIAPVLQSIVEDDELMSPSRRKAQSLLSMAAVPQK